MKKIIFLLLRCGVLMSMVGSGGNTAPPSTESPPTTVSKTVITETPTETTTPVPAVQPTEKEKELTPTESKDQSTEQRLISGIECSPDTALEEFRYVKQKYGKEDGRTYYHIVQSFAPDDDLTPETAHEIGLKFAEHFPGYQILVATHFNTGHIHNHLIMNSVNYQNGKKFHQTRDELLQVKAYSNKLCQEYGLSITEEKCSYGKWPEWKKRLRSFALYAISNSDTKEEFIACMREHGYKVRWEDKYKYITFTTPDNHVCRDKSLFDERLLGDNLEVYFALGGASSELYDYYNDYKTPVHTPEASMTVT